MGIYDLILHSMSQTQVFLTRVALCFAVLGIIYTRSTAALIYALTLPEPQGYVNDTANLLNTQAVTDLNDKLSSFAQKTTMDVVVLTVPDLQGETIEEYSVRLFEKWKIGSKDRDNGVLLLVARDERAVRIEVGYGLEGVLNDAKAGRIIRDVIVPKFQSGDYAGGITVGVDSILGIVSGEAPDIPARTVSVEGADGVPYILIFLVGSGLLQYIVAFLARTKTAWPGAIIGVVCGIIIALISSAVWGIAVILVGGLGVFGYLIDAMLSRNYQDRASRGLPTDWFHSGGGFFGGGRSGGGFGGFGGGRSGGGGASGRW